METTKIKQTSTTYLIGIGSDKSISVDINLTNKEFNIEEKIGLLKPAGITFSVGGCKNLDVLKELLNSVGAAVELIETEFAKIAELEPTENGENNSNFNPETLS